MATVLIVDPQEERRSELAFQLRTANYDVYLAEDGIVALSMLKRTRFDTVVTAECMPGLSGSALLRRVRDDFRYFYLPFVLLTDHTLECEPEQSLNEDLSLVLKSPVPITSLLAAMDAAMLRTHHKRRLALQ